MSIELNVYLASFNESNSFLLMQPTSSLCVHNLVGKISAVEFSGFRFLHFSSKSVVFWEHLEN